MREAAGSYQSVSEVRGNRQLNRLRGKRFSLIESSLRSCDTGPEFDIPGVINKDFKPGRWLEISSKALADISFIGGRFSVRLDLQMADGSMIRSDVEADIFQNEVRLYLSPLSFRRLVDRKPPESRDIAWFALTDRISGRRVTYGNPFHKPPKDIPPHKTIRALPIEETPFFFEDQRKYQREKSASEETEL